jgi:hypothetical protein
MLTCLIIVGFTLWGFLGAEDKRLRKEDMGGLICVAGIFVLSLYYAISTFWRYADVVVDDVGIRSVRRGHAIKAVSWSDIRKIRIVRVEMKQRYRTPPKPRSLEHGTLDEVKDAWFPLYEPCMGCQIETSDVKGWWRRRGPLPVEARLVGWDEFRAILNAEIRKRDIPVFDCRVKGKETPMASV